MNRKSNLLVGAGRTAFGLLVGVEAVLLIRMLITGEQQLLTNAPASALAFFVASALIHYVLAWTLLALSQRQIGVARTGAVTSAAPLVGTILAAFILDEPLTGGVVIGVSMAVLGVALVSLSRPGNAGSQRWVIPGYGLAVAGCWGLSPMFIRKGLEGLDAPLLGLTVGLGTALLFHSAILTASGAWDRPSWNPKALKWMVLGGLTGAIGIGAQWISFGLTTIAIAITVQQLAVLVVVALAPVMFGRTVERINATLLIGTTVLLAGSAIVVLDAI